MKTNDINSTGYKLHCLEIELAELQHELQAYKDLAAYQKMLQHDFKEIAAKGRETRALFLFKSYW